LSAAADLLVTRQIEEARPEDTVMAVQSGLSVEQARELLRLCKDDVTLATNLAMRVPVAKGKQEPAARPTRQLMIDLHGYYPKEAVALIGGVIKTAKEAGNDSIIRFITGRGNHSVVPGNPVLRPLLLRMAKRMGIHAGVDRSNDGIVIVYMGMPA